MSLRKRIAFFSRRLFLTWDRTIGLFFKGFGRFLQRLFFFAWAWACSRRWGYFVQGLPALAAGCGIVVLLLLRLSISANEMEARYLDRAQNAFKAKDYAEAMVCYERLASLGQDRPENLYEMAFSLAAQGETERAFKIMNQLAPLDETGYGQAHVWQAAYHWRNFASSQQRKLAESHLKSALQAGVADVDAVHALLGELYVRTGKPEEAGTHLARAVESRPQMRLLYATALEAQGKKSQAAEQAKMAANFYRTRAEADRKDRPARIGWAQAVLFLKDFPQALTILRDGFELSGDSAYRPAQAQLCLAWHDFLVQTKDDAVAKRWDLLQKGLELDSTNAQLIDRLTGYLGGGGAEGEKASALIRQTLAKGEATAISHFLLGLDAWQRNSKDEAELHWDRANQLAPNVPVIANNLAFLLAFDAKKTDLPRALKLIDLVIEQAPQNPTYRDTRGKIYARMGKWKEALADLELVNARDTNFPGIHAILAEIYAQLNDPGMAAEHRRLADAQEKKSKAAPK
jgi:tetratricopeptide (TPR) repeat protein